MHCREKIIKDIKDDLTFQECKSLIDQIVDFNTHTLSIAGGEPLLSPVIEDVLKYAAGKFKRLVISSNGTMIDKEKALMLSDYVTNVQISIDGPNAEIHDYIRGEGVFTKATKAIENLQTAGVKVGIRLTLCQLNKNFVIEYY